MKAQGLRTMRWLTVAAFACTVLPLQLQAAEGRKIEEVVVTAERKESTVSDTSISISAFTGEFLEDFGIRNQEDLQNYIPATVIEPYDMSIRGVGRNFRNLGGDPGVATYLNGVYSEDFGIASTEGGMYDLQRVEVLRGPQGTLYGRNAVGGAINFVTNGPTMEFEGELRTVIGTHGTAEYYGILSGPILQDVLAARFVGSKRTRDDGFHEGIGTGGDIGDYGDENYSVGLLFTPTESVEVNIRSNERSYRRIHYNTGGSIVLDENGGIPDEITGLARNTTAPVFGYRAIDRTETNPYSSSFFNPNAPLFTFTNPRTGAVVEAQRVRQGLDQAVTDEPNYLLGHNRQFTLDDPDDIGENDLKTNTSGQQDEFFDHTASSMDINWDVNDRLSVKYIFGYTDYFYDRTTDEELSDSRRYDETFYVSHTSEYESHELQFFYDLTDDISITSGLFYYEASIHQSGDFYSEAESVCAVGDAGCERRYRDAASAGFFDPILAGVFAGGGTQLPTGGTGTRVTFTGGPQADINSAARLAPTDLAPEELVLVFGPWTGDQGNRHPTAHGPATIGTNLEYETKTDRTAYAAYTQGEWRINEQFALVLGVRWARDELEGIEKLFRYNENLFSIFDDVATGVGLDLVTLGQYNVAIGALQPSADLTGSLLGIPNPALDANGNTIPTGLVPVRFQGIGVSESFYREVETSNEDVTWRINMDWTPNDDTLIYLSATKGVRSAGMNLVFFSQQATYEPEELIAYELGYKGTLADGRIQINASAYLYDYENLHTAVDVPSLTDPSSTSISVLPAPEAEVWGLEADILWLATDGLTVGGNISYTPSEYTADFFVVDPNDPRAPESLFSPADRTINVNGNQLLRVPEWKFNAWAEYKWQLGDSGSLRVSGTYSYIDEVYFSAFESSDDVAPEYQRVDLRATWESADENLTVAAFVNNLTNEIGIRGIDFTREEENFFRKIETTEPRLYGLEVRYRFGANR